jgi:hypothetical protein
VAEIHKYIQYYNDDYQLSYIGTRNVEVDLLVQRPGKPLLLIEIKSSEDVQPQQLTTLSQIGKDIPHCEMICLSRDKNKKKYGEITVWPWHQGILEFFGEP